jgi:hypothetical protein
MQVAWRTPLEKLDALEHCLNEWLETEENRWYEPSTNITFQHIVYQRYLELTIGITHNGWVPTTIPVSLGAEIVFFCSNWQDWGLRNTRRTAFHAAVQYYSRQLGIIGYEAPLPIVYSNPLAATDAQDHASPKFGGSTKVEDQTPLGRAKREAEAQAIERTARKMKPLLGFMPPLASRELTLTRSRKSKSRKAGLRGVDG